MNQTFDPFLTPAYRLAGGGKACPGIAGEITAAALSFFSHGGTEITEAALSFFSHGGTGGHTGPPLDPLIR